MRCIDLMKKDVVSIRPDDTVALAAKRMRDMNIGFLPVCDQSGRALGTVTDRDIAMRVDAEEKLASSCLVRDIMARDPVSCRASDDLTRLEERMADNKKSRMLITDDEGVLKGIVSLSDLAQFEGARRTGATIREITQRETRW